MYEQTIEVQRSIEKECYHSYCYLPLSTDINVLQFAYEHTGHAYAVSADHQCAYLTSPIADED